MPDVYISAKEEDCAVISCLGNQLQDYFHFVSDPASAIVLVEFIDTRADKLFTASRESGVTVSIFHSDQISRYCEVPRDHYLLVCVMLGLVYWRTLMLNPLLAVEDFLVREEKPGCLYAVRNSIQEYALAFEHPYVCRACLEFFRCLGAENETFALMKVLDSMSRRETMPANL
jgi:hypothetical protein